MGTAISWRAKLATRPWSFSLSYLIGSIALAIFVFEYSQPNWNPPREQELERADGYFVDQPRNATRPYLFQTDSGQKLMLGCSPEDLRTYCLANIGVPFASLIGHHVAIGFFQPTHRGGNSTGKLGHMRWLPPKWMGARSLALMRAMHGLPKVIGCNVA